MQKISIFSLSILITLTFVLCFAIPAGIAKAELVGYFPFDGSAADTTGHIISMSYTEYNTVGPLTYTTGPVGQAAYFDGTGDHIMFDTNSPIIYGSNSTTMFWAKRDTTAASDGTNDILLSKYNGAQITSVDTEVLSIKSSTVNFYKGNNTPILMGAKSTNNWVHITIVDNGTTLKYFENGVEKPNIISAYTPMNGINASYMAIYRTQHYYRYSNLSWVYYYKGWLDEFKLYNTALSINDIKTEYCKGNSSDAICTATITCSLSSPCSAPEPIGLLFCQGNNVYQNFKTYTCNNPGTSSSSCSNSTAAQLQTTCTGSQTCTNGSCTAVACSTNSACGTNGVIGSPFCQGNNVYQNYKTYTCNNPGTASSYCSDSTTAQLQTPCATNQICTNGSCTTSCTQNSQQRCNGNNLYWYDSCGNQGNLIQYCTNGCSGNTCITNTCTYHASQRCSGSYLYWYDSCGTQQELAQYCTNGCSGNACTTNYCTQNSSQRCSGNNLYWYDSCGVQGSFIQYCTNGCSGNACTTNNYNPYGNCTYHAYKLCVGGSIYWYDSCGTQQDLYNTCSGGQTCQYGQCVFNTQTYVAPQTNYVVNYRTACSGNSVSWYDSLGVASGLYQNCADNNSCTIDSCFASRCSNILKCDESTCLTGSADYKIYCQASQPVTTNNLSLSFFSKQNLGTTQWQKTTQADSNSQVYFMISALNNSTAQIDNVNISANIPTEISSLGNLQLNGVPVSGDIVTGINIGSIAPSTTKLITFEGKTQVISSLATKQATATSNVLGATQSDSVSINLTPSQATAAVSNTQTTSGFGEFLKRWYLWILGAIVLVFLFVVVFKRLSSDA